MDLVTLPRRGASTLPQPSSSSHREQQQRKGYIIQQQYSMGKEQLQSEDQWREQWARLQRLLGRH
jgi:hypothetical protein